MIMIPDILAQGEPVESKPSCQLSSIRPESPGISINVEVAPENNPRILTKPVEISFVAPCHKNIYPGITSVRIGCCRKWDKSNVFFPKFKTVMYV